jgi:hypothetical protein
VEVVTPYLVSSQYCGFTGDGVYKHTKVPEKLDRHFGRRGVFTHDLMHQAALVDTRMRNPKEAHTWLNSLTQTIGSSIAFIQWGKEWMHFFQLYTERVEEGKEARVLRPKSFSETKMANHVKDVYKRFREILPSLMKTLEEVKLEYACDGGAGGGNDGAEKARKADSIMGKIYNARFLLTLSALIDIYSVYSTISNNFQVVNRLAFDRKDIFDHNLHKFEKMLSSVEVCYCPCSFFFDYEEDVYLEDEDWGTLKDMVMEVCDWPVLHGDICELKMRGTYRGVIVGCMEDEGSKTRAGVEQTTRVMVLDLGKVIKTVNERAGIVTTFLHNGLSNDVYSNTDVIYLDNIRRLLDLKKIVKSIDQYGAASVSSNQYRSWLDAAKFLENDLFARISANELRLQYRDFMSKLGELAPNVINMDNTEIFALFLNPSLGYYKNIEGVIGILANAGVVMGLESVVESWVSVLEHHNNSQRPLTQERLEQEGMIAINGPLEVHCDSVVEEALSSYWGKQQMGNHSGHWIRRSSHIKSYVISEAVDGIVNKKPAVPFMC